jgi:hypothetical protein
MGEALRKSAPAVTSGMLCGWAEISAYLGISLRSAHRMHAQRALPVFRWRGLVSSTRAAIDAYLLARPIYEGRKYAVPQPRCPHCGLRPSDPPREPRGEAP